MGVQNEETLKQVQKRSKIWASFSVSLPQKVHWGLSFNSILVRSLLIGTFLCRSMNWNFISLVLLVYLGASWWALDHFMCSLLPLLRSFYHHSWLWVREMYLWDISFVNSSRLPDRGFRSLAEKLSYTRLLTPIFTNIVQFFVVV